MQARTHAQAANHIPHMWWWMPRGGSGIPPSERSNRSVCLSRSPASCPRHSGTKCLLLPGRDE
eukprot:5167141-Prorocentrum_lima.AAC.1